VSMILIDILVAVGTALLLSMLLMRFAHLHGPWRRPWAFPLVIFLFAWAGGALAQASEFSGWLIYAIPFVLAGLVAAMLIVATSPRHDLKTREDSDEFRREQEAVLVSVTVFFWALIGVLVAAVAMAYLH